MDTGMQAPRHVRHPYQGRRPRGPSLAGFVEMLRNHVFVFRKAVSGYDMKDEQLGDMITDLDREMAIYRQAWEGGDEFMKVLSSHMVMQRREMIPAKTADDTAAEIVLLLLDDDVKEYALKLGRFDWYHSFSDDGAVLRNGAEREEQLKKTANEKGGLHLKLWNYYTQQRSDNISGKNKPPK
jgi:hypothetical protein